MRGKKCESGCTCKRHSVKGRPVGSGTRPLADRFWEKVKRGPGCWEWQGSTTSTGYGKVMVGGAADRRLIGAHRASWLLTYGEESPEWVLHKCDNRLCVRPDHLFSGTAQDNTDDMASKERGWWQIVH